MVRARRASIGRPDHSQHVPESRLGSKDVEVRFDRQADERRAAALGAALELRERLVRLADLRVTAGGDHERPALPERLAAPTEDRVEALGLERAADEPRLFRTGN